MQAAFTELFSASFSIKRIPLAKQDPDFSHPIIEVVLLKRKKGASDANLCAMEAAEETAAQEAAASQLEEQLPEQPSPEQQPLQQPSGAELQQQLGQLTLGAW